MDDRGIKHLAIPMQTVEIGGEQFTLREMGARPRRDFVQILVDVYREEQEAADKIAGRRDAAVTLERIRAVLAPPPDAAQDLRSELQTVLDEHNSAQEAPAAVDSDRFLKEAVERNNRPIRFLLQRSDEWIEEHMVPSTKEALLEAQIALNRMHEGNLRSLPQAEAAAAP